jgi:hypothetical protein
MSDEPEKVRMFDSHEELFYPNSRPKRNMALDLMSKYTGPTNSPANSDANDKDDDDMYPNSGDSVDYSSYFRPQTRGKGGKVVSFSSKPVTDLDISLERPLTPDEMEILIYEDSKPIADNLLYANVPVVNSHEDMDVHEAKCAELVQFYTTSLNTGKNLSKSSSREKIRAIQVDQDTEDETQMSMTEVALLLNSGKYLEMKEKLNSFINETSESFVVILLFQCILETRRVIYEESRSKKMSLAKKESDLEIISSSAIEQLLYNRDITRVVNMNILKKENDVQKRKATGSVRFSAPNLLMKFLSCFKSTEK